MEQWMICLHPQHDEKPRCCDLSFGCRLDFLHYAWSCLMINQFEGRNVLYGGTVEVCTANLQQCAPPSSLA